MVFRVPTTGGVQARSVLQGLVHHDGLMNIRVSTQISSNKKNLVLQNRGKNTFVSHIFFEFMCF